MNKIKSINAVSPVLEVKNLWKVFPKGQRSKGKKTLNIDVHDHVTISQMEKDGKLVVAVRDVSFEIYPGEIFIVMGLSGSGKSTLIRCLMRLIEVTAGTVKINGLDVTSLSKKELVKHRRYQAAMVFQHYGLLPHKTVLDNVAFGLKLRGEPKEERYRKAKAAIERVGLKGWENYYPAALSGGMQQRVGIARALVMDAPVLLMDEPFSGLDPLISRQLQDELLRLQEEMKKSIMFVTHDLSEALRLGNRMAIMRKGSIVQIGTPDEIVSNPADDYVAAFVADERRTLEKTKLSLGSKLASAPASS
ncbi:MAG TPA: ATP-binding cassette domain-containing protein [Acetomicrobium sp.]|nr:ATP-binding cassette domain-containing protein [Acetomicrobium sp.]